MHVDILAIGSHGDVRPNVAFGRGLQRQGHHVRVVTLGGFEDFVRGNGLDHLSIGLSPQDIANTAQGRYWVEHRTSAVGFFRGFMSVAESLIEEGVASYWSACSQVDALIATPMGLAVGMHVAERLRVPLIRVSFVPSRHDWAEHRSLATIARGRVAASVWAACRILMWMRLRPVTNRARRRILALPPLSLREPLGRMDRKGIPLFDAYSPTVAPRPSSWDDWLHVTGYWFLDDTPSWTPSSALVDFLASGPPPVFVGFGSTPFPEPEAATELVVAALRQAGQRGVVVSGGSGLATGRLSDDVLGVDYVPHAWLFPQVSAAVHQGGAGVTGEALRAGLPSVVVPVFADQPFWGRRVYEVGAGPRPIPPASLSVESLANGIRQASSDQDIRRQTARIGRRIREEDGVARAVEAFDQYVGS